MLSPVISAPIVKLLKAFKGWLNKGSFIPPQNVPKDFRLFHEIIICLWQPYRKVRLFCLW